MSVKPPVPPTFSPASDVPPLTKLSGKIKHADLGPRSDVLALATAGKWEVKLAVLRGDWDTGSGKVPRLEWAWAKLQILAQQKETHEKALKHVEERDELKGKLLVYVSIFFDIKLILMIFLPGLVCEIQPFDYSCQQS
jgi:hypothetical protein